MRASLALLTLSLTSLAHAATLATAITAEDETLRGELLALDASPAVTLGVEGKPRKLPCSDLIELVLRDARPAPRSTDAAILLRDGGVLRGAVRGGGGRAVAVESAALGRIECPLGAVARIDLPAAGAAAAPPEAAGKADRLFLLSDEVVEGTVESIEEGKVVFGSAALGKLDVPFDRIRSIAFAAEAAAPPRAAPGVVAIVHADDASVLSGRLGPLAEGRLAFEAAFGARLSLDLARLLRVEFRGGRLVYLSDLDPAEVKETPFFDLVWAYRRDRSVDGNPLRIGSATYRKGLGVHSRCELSYALDGAVRRFVADVGLDEEVGERGNVDVRVLVDGQVKFERKALTGRDAPLRVELDLTGAKRLTLLADFGPELDIADHLDWANARLIR
jgi:hypothetical protein